MTRPLTKIGPGVYSDGEGGMHLEFGELLRANHFADTAENRAMLERTWREWSATTGTPITFTDEPIVRVATDAEQLAALVALARQKVADGAGHECSEWVIDGRCELCGAEVRHGGIE